MSALLVFETTCFGKRAIDLVGKKIDLYFVNYSMFSFQQRRKHEMQNNFLSMENKTSFCKKIMK